VGEIVVHAHCLFSGYYLRPDLDAKVLRDGLYFNEVPGVRPGRAVAFGVPDPRLGTEAEVIVCEVNGSIGPEETRRIESELRRRIAQQTEVTLHDVRLMHGPWLIKTSSGKLARAANREKYLREQGGS
jgi:fatty-acyl-CoA synthase